jgi:putative flippase GtrA
MAADGGFVGCRDEPEPRPQSSGQWYVVIAAVTAARTSPAWRGKALLLRLVVFACVGGLFNVVYAVLYVVLRAGLDAQWANALALVASTIAGTAGHRRVTFGVRGRERTVPHQVLGLVLLAFSLAVTAGSLRVLELNVASPSRTAELLVLIAANLGTGLVRFVAFQAVMPERRPRSAAPR